MKIKVLWGKVTTKKPDMTTLSGGIQLQTVTISEFDCRTSDISLNGGMIDNPGEMKTSLICDNLSLTWCNNHNCHFHGTFTRKQYTCC